MHMLLVNCVAALCSLVAFGQDLSSQKAARIDSLFHSSPDFFNGNVLVIENGSILYRHAFGMADIAAGIPNTENTSFQTASLSKPFTAIAVLQLAEQKKLALSDPLQRFFPEFPFSDITILQLLSHTSGLPDIELYESLIAEQPDRIVRNADVIPTLLTTGEALRFPPGSAYRYCNTNYQLLALLVEKVSGDSFAAYLEKHIFRACGMHDSYVREQGTPLPAAKNHVLLPEWAVVPQHVDSALLSDLPEARRIRYESYHLGGTYGDQNVITTLADLLLFDQALYTNKLLKTASRRLLFEPAKLSSGDPFQSDFGAPFPVPSSYACGWIVGENGSISGHDGYNRGICTLLYRDTKNKRTLILFDNTEGYGFSEKAANILHILDEESLVAIDMRLSAVRQFGDDLLRKTLAEALLALNENRLDSLHYYCSAREMNLLGYDLLYSGQTANALDVFQTNLLLHPERAGFYDSYAEALVAAERYAEALLYYEKALEMAPETNATRQALEALRELISAER